MYAKCSIEWSTDVFNVRIVSSTTATFHSHQSCRISLYSFTITGTSRVLSLIAALGVEPNLPPERCYVLPFHALQTPLWSRFVWHSRQNQTLYVNTTEGNDSIENNRIVSRGR